MPELNLYTTEDGQTSIKLRAEGEEIEPGPHGATLSVFCSER